jgi:hypothetical protein
MNVSEAKENLRRSSDKVDLPAFGKSASWPMLLLVFVAGGVVGFVPRLRKLALRGAALLQGPPRGRLF